MMRAPSPHKMLSNRLFYIINLILALTILMFLSGCGSAKVSQVPVPIANQQDRNPYQSDAKQYPDWFWNMPVADDTIYAVGYSETSAIHISDSEQRAIDDGLKNLSRFYSVRVRLEQKSIRSAGVDILDNNEIPEEVSSEAEAYVKENYQVIKKFVSRDYTLVLVKLGSKDESEPENSIGSALIPAEPRWVTSLPKELGSLYAVGESTLYFRELDSWRIAEKKALLALALSMGGRIRDLVKSLDDQMVNISSISVDTELSNAKIISRWKNMELGTCHILMKMKVDNEIISRNIQQSDQIKESEQEKEKEP
jgi:hypothetical protein